MLNLYPVLILQVSKLCNSRVAWFPIHLSSIFFLPRWLQLLGEYSSPDVHRTHAFPPGCPTAHHPVRDPAAR